jgi:spermidine synthase
MTGPMRARVAAIASLLLGSGFCALIYQTAWFRTFRLIFGASTVSTSAVLAIFMGGLGLGALRIGKLAERHPRPLALYGNLELTIAVGAAASPFLLDLVRACYIALGGTASLGGPLATVLRLVLAALVLLVPVFAMGGTLSAAARAITQISDVGRKGLALIYGINTLGSVFGALAGTLVLFQDFGTRTTLFIACAINVVIGLSARLIASRTSASAAVEPSPAGKSEGASSDIAKSWVLGVAFIVGFSFFVAELVWYRMASPILGGSTYTFGLLLACALFGIGVGGILYAWIGPTRSTAAHLALSCALEAAALLVPYALGDDLAEFAASLRYVGRASFFGISAGWLVVSSILALPASIVAGYQLPLLFALKGRGARGVAEDVGQVYAANTIGAIVGSLAGGMGLMPLLTAPGAWLLSALMLATVAAIIGVRAARVDKLRGAVVVGLVLVSALLIRATGPTAVWRHGGIGAGRSSVGGSTRNELEAARRQTRNQMLFERDGVESSLGVAAKNGLAFLINGKIDGNATSDAMTAALSGLLGATTHPDPKTAFVIGLGSGETAGWLAAIPSMQRVEVVELEPAVVEFAEMCAPANHDALKNPKVHLTIGDGRESLVTTREKFDVIASEPSNPFRAGIASFFSVDFYRQTSERLAPNGFFLQWVQGYEIDASTMMIAISSLHAVYRHVSIWRLSPGDFLMFATQEPQVIDVDLVRARLKQEPYRTVFGRVAGIYDAEGLISMHLGNDQMADLISRSVGLLNTDDRTVLEYMFARTVGQKDLGVRDGEFWQAAAKRGLDRPAVRGQVDWDRVEELRPRGDHVLQHRLPSEYGKGPLSGFWHARSLGQLAEAARLSESARAPLDPFERLARAHARSARRESPEQRQGLLLELDALEREDLGNDAKWVVLTMALTDGRFDLVPNLAGQALAAAREDPWINGGVILYALRMMASRLTPEVARPVAIELARGPLSAFHEESARREILRRIAFKSGDWELCARVYEEDEPNASWTLEDLTARADCYAHAHAARGDEAKRDLEDYKAHEAKSLEVELSGSSVLSSTKSAGLPELKAD